LNGRAIAFRTDEILIPRERADLQVGDQDRGDGLQARWEKLISWGLSSTRTAEGGRPCANHVSLMRGARAFQNANAALLLGGTEELAFTGFGADNLGATGTESLNRRRVMSIPKDRIRSIVHQGKPVLFVDCSHCSAKEVGDICYLVPKFVSKQPIGSVLLLADFTGATFDRACIERLKVSIVLDRPHLKRSAWVGTGTLPKVFYENLRTFGQRDLPTFEDKDEALNWLAQQD